MAKLAAAVVVGSLLCARPTQASLLAFSFGAGVPPSAVGARAGGVGPLRAPGAQGPARRVARAVCPALMCDVPDERAPGSRTVRRRDLDPDDAWGEPPRPQAARDDTWGEPLEEVDDTDLESPYLDEAVLSSDYRTLHRDLYSWHDIYDWYRSYHNTLCISEATLKLRRELLEALSAGNLLEAGRLRDDIIVLSSKDEVAHLQERLDSAVNMEDYELAAKLRDELFHSKLAREAASFPKYEVGLIVEHVRHHYRGVVLALDKRCQASEEWMETMEVDKLSRGRRQPFYSILVDINDRGPEPQITYVAQENLLPSEHGDLVEHPLVERLFEGRIEERAAPHNHDAEQEIFDYRYNPGPELETMLEFMAQSQQND